MLTIYSVSAVNYIEVTTPATSVPEPTISLALHSAIC